MATKKAQPKTGIPANRRGQQMGDERSNAPNKLAEAKQNTPALRGRRKDASQFYADDSAQQSGSDAATPRTNSPSVAGAIPTNVKLGRAPGEARQAAQGRRAKAPAKGRGSRD